MARISRMRHLFGAHTLAKDAIIFALSIAASDSGAEAFGVGGCGACLFAEEVKMRFMGLTVAAAMLATTATFAADVESGVPVGGSIGTYSTTKCAGVEDGVKVGASLCYT